MERKQKIEEIKDLMKLVNKVYKQLAQAKLLRKQKKELAQAKGSEINKSSL